MGTEFCLSPCQVPLLTRLPGSKVPRPSLPTQTGTISLAARTILAPCFYIPGRNSPQEIHPALFLSTQRRKIQGICSCQKDSATQGKLHKGIWGRTGQTDCSHTCARMLSLSRQLNPWYPSSLLQHEDSQPSYPRGGPNAGIGLAHAERESCLVGSEVLK